MMGLYVLFIAVVWLAIALAIAHAVTSRIKSEGLRTIATLMVGALLLPLPLIDEIIGKQQFEKLCKEYSTIQVDRSKAVGKTVYLATTADVEIKGKWLRILLKPWRFVDATTGETVVRYNTLTVSGGRVAQTFGFSEARVPLTFANHDCAPKNPPASAQAFEALGIKYIEPPTIKKGGQK